MILYLDARTTVKDLMIDYIEVELANRETASLNWDESDIGRADDGFSARYKGVYFGEVYANGRLEQGEYEIYILFFSFYRPGNWSAFLSGRMGRRKIWI